MRLGWPCWPALYSWPRSSRLRQSRRAASICHAIDRVCYIDKSACRLFSSSRSSSGNARQNRETDHDRTVQERISNTPFGRYASIKEPLHSPASSSSSSSSDGARRFVPEQIERPSYLSHALGKENEVEFGLDVDLGLPIDPGSRGAALSEIAGELLNKMRRTGALAKEALSFAKQIVEPGISTLEINNQVHDFITSHGAYPSPLGYLQYPCSLTASVNNILAHGIPSDRPLIEGDIVCLDVTLFKEGVHGDTSDTFCVGQVDPQGQHLVRVTQKALQMGIEALAQGVQRGNAKFSDIGNAISAFAESEGFAVNRQYTGHGIDTLFHRPPWILHHSNTLDIPVPKNIAFTIEPILVQVPPRVKPASSMAKGHLWKDGWTMASVNGGRAAQAEHTVWVGEDRIEVLTK